MRSEKILYVLIQIKRKYISNLVFSTAVMSNFGVLLTVFYRL